MIGSLKHTCKDGDAARYQEKQYGAGKRVFTVSKSKITCTVCGATQARPGEAEIKQKK